MVLLFLKLMLEIYPIKITRYVSLCLSNKELIYLLAFDKISKSARLKTMSRPPAPENKEINFIFYHFSTKVTLINRCVIKAFNAFVSFLVF